MNKPVITRVRSGLAPWVRELHGWYLRIVYGMDIGPGVDISLSARLDKTNPRGVHIGEYTSVSFEAVILTHDFVNSRHLEVHIGKNCLLAARSIVYPGVTIGDHCIVSAASVVTRNIPPHCIVAGNPARIVETGPFGRRLKPAAAPTPTGAATGSCETV